MLLNRLVRDGVVPHLHNKVALQLAQLEGQDLEVDLVLFDEQVLQVVVLAIPNVAI